MQGVPLNELALFAGAGGGLLGGKLLGWRTVCAVEVAPYAQDVLLARQRDGIFDPFPVWDDVQTFDGHPWRGLVNVVSGGFPCQDISVAGKGAGISGARSGLWSHMARIVGEVRPEYVFIENSPALITRGLDRVLADLAALGFDAAWRVLSAEALGAPHLRERIWIVANANGERQLQPQGRQRHERRRTHHGASHLADADPARLEDGSGGKDEELCWLGAAHHAGCRARRCHRWPAEPDVARMVHGLSGGVGRRIAALGNAQVPAVAAAAFTELAAALASERHPDHRHAA